MDSSSELVCPICFETFDDAARLPRILPDCGHSLCTDCLQNLIKNVASRDHLCCPKDRTPFRRFKPSAGLKYFPKNYPLLSLYEKKRTKRELLKENRFCGVHKKKIKFVCMKDMRPVCYGCVFAGCADHNEELYEVSRFAKTLNSSVAALGQMKLDEVTFLREINRKKSALFDLMYKKKKELVDSIVFEFEKIAKEIDHKKYEILEQLDGAFKKIEENIKSVSARSESLGVEKEQYCIAAQDMLRKIKLKKFDFPELFAKLINERDEDNLVTAGRKLQQDLLGHGKDFLHVCNSLDSFYDFSGFVGSIKKYVPRVEVNEAKQTQIDALGLGQVGAKIRHFYDEQRFFCPTKYYFLKDKDGHRNRTYLSLSSSDEESSEFNFNRKVTYSASEDNLIEKINRRYHSTRKPKKPDDSGPE